MFFQSVFAQKEQNQERQNEASTGRTLVNYDVSENKVLSIISYLNENKSRGHDKLPASLKKTPALSKSISYLFKAIKDKCKFPDAWKTGEIQPICKKGDKSLFNNYRLITFLCILSKDPGEMHVRFFVPLRGKSDPPFPTREFPTPFQKRKLSLSYLCTSAESTPTKLLTTTSKLCTWILPKPSIKLTTRSSLTN